MPPKCDPEDSFWRHVERTNRCWLWTGSVGSTGYGQIRASGRLVKAHRFSYELLIGPLGPDERLDHDRRCPKNCVNPYPHWLESPGLRIVTPKQNGENRQGANRNNRSSGVRGVSWDKSRSKWLAQAMSGGRTHIGGRFDTIEEAEAAAIDLRSRLFTHSDGDLRNG